MTNIEGFGREFSAFTESISPDEEDLINGIEGIYLQLVVRVSAIDEEFQIILQKDQRIALRQTRLDVGLLGLESDIEVGLTPQDGAASSELCLPPPMPCRQKARSTWLAAKSLWLELHQQRSRGQSSWQSNRSSVDG